MIRVASSAWLALAALAVVCAALWLIRRRSQRFPFPAPRGYGRPRLARGMAAVLPGLLAAAALAPLAVAAARPQEVLARRLEHVEGIDIAVALDVSGSMAALDFRPSDRLRVAKQVIDSFLDRRPDDRFAIVAFAGAAVTLCPLTLDHRVAHQLLDRVGPRTLPDGTAIGVGLGTALTRLRSSSARSKVVILVTDGSNNAGQIDPLTAADLAAKEGVMVHTVLVGRGGKVPVPIVERDPRSGRERTRVRQVEVEVNPELLAEISRRTGGTSFRARDPEALVRVFGEIDAMEKTELRSTRLVRYRERFEPWALAALALLLGATVLEGVGGGTPW